MPASIIPVRVALEPNASVDLEKLVDRLFTGVQTTGCEAHWQNNVLTVERHPLVRQYLLELLGSNVSLADLDKSISRLINKHKAVPESKSDDEIVLRSRVVNLNVELICRLIGSTLSQDLIVTPQTLLLNIGEILSSNDLFSKTQRIVTEVHARCMGDPANSVIDS